MHTVNTCIRSAVHAKGQRMGILRVKASWLWIESPSTLPWTSYVDTAIHHLPVGFALVRESLVVPVAFRFRTRRMSTCVAIARVPCVSGRNGQRSLSQKVPRKWRHQRPHTARDILPYIAPRTRGEDRRGCIQSVVAVRACVVCSYKVHSLTLEVSWNTISRGCALRFDGFSKEFAAQC